MSDFSFEIMEELGKLSQEDNGWTKELTVVRWNKRDPKFDIRSWDPNKKRMGRGVTFTKDEIMTLRKLLDKVPV